ncbi:MAG: phosphate signaling complex protein PhoU [Halieaceae bacterium]|nr:phosphate signaling complex protein PhoU [Halieaceae bacterium]
MADISPRQHISAQFNAELEALQNALLEMGGNVERQIELAAEALLRCDSGLAEEAIDLDRDINRMEVEIDEQCVRILARRQPAASDLRLIISTVKVITDLERIGDEASKVARQAVRLATTGVDNPVEAETRRITRHVIHMLRQVLDGFARLEVSEAARVILSDDDIDEDYELALGKLQSAMRQNQQAIPVYMHIVWALRSLERIGDHASNIAEQVVYLARGVDVRHSGSEGIRELLG